MMKYIVKYMILFALTMSTITFILYNNFINKLSNFYGINKSESDVVLEAEPPTSFNKSDVFIAVKTTHSNHKTRLKTLMDTWISTFKHQTYIFTDKDDLNLKNAMPDGRVINTKCARSHNIVDLACKLGKEIETFVESGKKWFCHVDDDNYLNIDKLMETLDKYNYTDRWYLGKPSLNHPWSLNYQKELVQFWFGTGGAGFCFSWGLRSDLWLHARSEQLVNSAIKTGEADDVAIAFVVHYFMKVNMTTVGLFHSHLENLTTVTDPLEQITISYHGDNRVNVTGFDVKEDPSRFKSVHCHLHPKAEICKRSSR